MTEYVLDIKTNDHVVIANGYRTLPLVYDINRAWVEYYFKIDNNGNVDILKLEKTQDGRPNRQGQVEPDQVLKINDNIPIPSYFIDIIKFLINPITIGDIEHYKLRKSWTSTDVMTDKRQAELLGDSNAKNSQLTERYWEIVVNTIKRIKQEVKELIENPQDTLDIKIQLNASISKIKQQQGNITELDKKIENIQTAYFDTLNDNKKLKEMIKIKDNKQTELEIENKRLLQELNNIKQLDEYNKKEQQKMEELEKERLWREYKQQKQNFNPLYN